MWDINGEEVPYDFSVPLSPKKPWTLWDEYQDALTQCRAILAAQITPLAAYSSVCKLCHWYTFCVEQLTAADDLTLIPYLGRSLRDAMKDTVASVAALAASNPDVFMEGKTTIFPGLGQDRLRLFHERAVMLSQPDPKPYLRAPISLRVAPVELFFDVEVDPLRDICYLHGFMERHDGRNETEKFVYFFAEEVSNRGRTGCLRRSLRLPYAAGGRRDLLLFKIRAHHLPQASGLSIRTSATPMLSNGSSTRLVLLTFMATSCCRRRNGRHETIRSRRSPNISALPGVTPIPQARQPSSGSIGGVVIASLR